MGLRFLNLPLLLVAIGCQRPQSPTVVPPVAGTPDRSATVQVVSERIEEGESRVHWRWVLTSDVPLNGHLPDPETVLLLQDVLGDSGSTSWVLDLDVSTKEAPNGLMDVRVGRSLRPTGGTKAKAVDSSTPIRALNAPADRTVTILADGQSKRTTPISLPLVRLNLKASDGASLTREVVLKVDRNP